MAGFDAISNHIGLILFSLVLDLILWLGPRLQLSQLVNTLFAQTASLSDLQAAEMTDMLRTSREVWTSLAERFNLLSTLRTYPVGIPSLMVSRAPAQIPTGQPFNWEVPSLLGALVLWLAFSLVGLLAGSLYFKVVSEATLDGGVNWSRLFIDWPWAAGQVLLLAAFWLALILGVSIPFTCLLSVLLLTGFNLGQFAILLFGGLLVWMLLPLIFSAHGIFVNRQKMWASVQEGVRLTRMTLPTTGLFLLVVILLSEGLDVLWRVPAENSWLALVGVAGHAFVTAGLLAASFVYYRDADRWMRNLLQQMQASYFQDKGNRA